MKAPAAQAEPAMTPEPQARSRVLKIAGQDPRIRRRQLADTINWDYAVIERLNEADLSSELIPFNLGKVVLEGDGAQNLPLKPGDVVTVFSKTDVRAPAARRPVVVSLEGEFNHAGVYQALPGETLRQLVVRAGGLTEKAYVFGAEFQRESTRALQEQRLQRVVDQMEQEIQRIAGERARGALSQEDVASAKQEFAAQQAMLARLRGLRPSGRVVLEVPEDSQLKDIPDVALEDGDRLFVPERPSSVSVFGSVYSEAAFLYRPEKALWDYLAQAGGPRGGRGKHVRGAGRWLGGQPAAGVVIGFAERDEGDAGGRDRGAGGVGPDAFQ
jgi:polysaccharide export outer membrane protein